MSLPTMHLEAVLFSSIKPISIELMLSRSVWAFKEETQKYIEELQRTRRTESRYPITNISWSWC